MSQSTGELNIGIPGQYIQPTQIDMTQVANGCVTMFVLANDVQEKVVTTMVSGDIC